MERSVIFRDRQELQSSDLGNQQGFARDSIDHVVQDAVTAGVRRYTGFAVTKTGANQVTVSGGRFYANGPVYFKAEDTVIDLFNVMPLLTKKKVAITVYGTTIEVDVQPRDFLVDPETGATEPESVAMEQRRRAEVGSVAGSEAPDPQAPAVDANYLIIAYVTLDPNEVIQVEQVEANRLPSVAGNAAAITDLSNWRNQTGRRIDTVVTDVANIKDSLELYATDDDIRKIWDKFAQIEKDIAQPAAYVLYETDYLLDPATGDPAEAGYSAVHDEGIRFPNAASNLLSPDVLALYNPTDPAIVINSNFILPKFDDTIRLDCTGYTGEINIGEYVFSNTEIVQLTRTRERIRYGETFIVCTNSNYWRLGQYDPISHTLRYNGETFEVVNWQDVQNQQGLRLQHYQVRLKRMFVDTVEENYWDRVTSTATISGQKVAQTFLWAADGWLSAVGLYFSRVAATGNVEVLIAETFLGQPDMNKVLARVTLNRADIQVGTGNASAGLPNIRETKVPIQPTLLKGGQRYALIVNANAQHYLATTTADNAVINGTCFRTTDGGYFLGDLVTDIKLRFYGAQFRSNRATVQFAPYSLVGGVTWVDLTYEANIPAATMLTWEAYVDNRWQPFDPGDNGVDFTVPPAVLQIRAVFTGTKDLMPGIGIGTKSRVLYGRGATAFNWASDNKHLPSGCDNFKIMTRLESFDAGVHTCAVTLKEGSTTHTAVAVQDRIVEGGAIERTSTFALGGNITDYKIKIAGTTASAINPFLVSIIRHYATT
ncbi:hypothetical protein [Chelatococcus asaccharovorans]|uniref:Uncharacterized protein n=1 Tax=Chelatococcus asaccharovorans TaxID=28210 RepID=A0A2V3UAZ4_9HYPH|nr:hypothetical protein [Chelatococcus asaccharovorans]MBS7703322.1 hypothetical protein [Chelatococcus asaccharovorans]PXW61655.1 hypothetical protein C7450_103172 [Chelatococcus asaccharovorans]